MKRSFLAITAFSCLIAIGGCKGKIQQETSVSITPIDLKSIDLVPAKSLTIDFASKDNVPITAVLVKTEDAAAALKSIDEGKTPEQAIAAAKSMAKQENQPRGTLTTPRSESKVNYSVLFTAKKDTTITFNIKGE